MHAYQDRGAKWLIDHHDAGLFFDPGLGKSITTLTAIADLKARGELGGKVLIVGPPRVVTTVWAQEAAAWEHTAGLKVLVLAGTPEQRKQLLVERFRSADIVAVSYGLLSWLHKLVKRERWFWVVIDESSMIKDHRSKRWRNVAYTALAAKRRTILTGTPTPKSLADLWAQVTVADLGRRFGKSPTRFLNRYFIQDLDGRFVLRRDARQALTEQLRDFALALRAKDYLDLPALVETVVPVTMPPSAWAVYEELARSFEAELADGTQIDVANAGVMAGKLQQVAQGSIVVDASGTWQELHTAKLDAVEELVSELGGEPVLIAYWYKHDLARLKTLFPEAPVLGGSLSERKLNGLIQRWNQGAISVLLFHPQCLDGSTEVLTETRGWVRIVDVLSHERVFDGVEFVAHGGCSYSGLKEVIEVFGIKMTPDHKLLVSGKWEKAEDVRDSADARRKAQYRKEPADSGRSEVQAVRERAQDAETERRQAQRAPFQILQTLCQRPTPQCDKSQDAQDLARDSEPLSRPGSPWLQALWWSGDLSLRALVGFRAFLRRHARRALARLNDRTHRRGRRLLEGELPLGHEHGTASEQTQQSRTDIQGRIDASSGAMPKDWSRQSKNARPAGQGHDPRRGCCERQGIDLRDGPLGTEIRERAHVYDLVNCGPRSRFLIRNANGEMFISHNSAGHGLNLQAGGRHLIWMAVPWSWELYTQATARLYRQGQTKPVMVYRIITEGTIDERILQVLADRQDGHDTLVAALKAEVRQTVDRVKAARAAMQKAHPDRGGSTEAFIAARKAYEQAKKEAA
ncbi:SNF2-related protein [Lamprobacter modestohalophilus]|uniref:SNF2-related protein n=1 Tax=Lamprobacter modestohalophilus TaxID=1064514 RepID=UPI002ADEDAC7|nr:SNF2-related protein [Lamprobacter modestohalophilus]MEA1050484.1 SNF2-related protein [Lamprobacter modestohalophilus]